MLLLWSGCAATLLVVVLAYVLRWAGLTRLEPVRHTAGLLADGAGSGAGRLSALALLLLTGGVLLPFAYWLIFTLAGRADWLLGLTTGALQGLLFGLIFPALPRRDATLPRPGLFGYRLGWFTPLALLGLHALYGAVLGQLYLPLR
jgi:hypothetical protein